jgi:hypothetical protein
MNCILNASVAAVVNTGDPALVAQISGSSIANASSESVRTSLIMVQNLLRRQAMLQMRTDRDASHFKSSSPRLLRDRASLKILRQSLDEEMKRAAGRAQNDLDAASQAEQHLQAENQVDRTVALQLSDRTIDYAILPTQARQSRQLYQSLLKRLRDAGVLQLNRSSNFTVVAKATPLSAHDNSRAPLYLALSGGFGFFACCLALLVDVDETRKREEVEGWTLRVNGSIMPPIRGMNRAAFQRSARGSQPGWHGLTLMPRKESAVKALRAPVSRVVMNATPGQVSQMRSLTILRPAVGGRTDS